MAFEPKPIAQETEANAFSIGGEHNDPSSSTFTATNTMRVQGLTSMFSGVADPEAFDDSSPESKRKRENETLDRIIITQSLKNSIAATQQILAELEQDREATLNRIDELNIQILDCDEQLISIRQTIESDRVAIQNVESRTAETSQKADALNEKIQEQQALIEQDDVAIAQETEQKVAAEQEAAALAESRGFFGQIVHDAAVATGFAEEDACVKKAAECENNICNLTEAREEHSHSLDSLITEVESVKQDLNALELERAELQEKLDSDLQKQSDITSLRSGLVNELGTEEKRLAELDSEIAETKIKLESLEDQLQQQQDNHAASEQDASLSEPEPEGYNPAFDEALQNVQALIQDGSFTVEAFEELKTSLPADLARQISSYLDREGIEPEDTHKTRPHIFGGEGHRQEIVGLSPNAARAEHVSVSAQNDETPSPLMNNFAAQASANKPEEPTTSLAKDMTNQPTVEFTGALSA